MFETAEIGRKISKKEYESIVPELHTSLLTVQRELINSDIPVIIIISGVEGAGRSDVVNCFNKWLDTRGIRTSAFWDISDEEIERPRFWRFWRRMPSRGSIGIMYGAWYTQTIVDYVNKKIDTAEFEKQLQGINKLEHMLTKDKALIVKFWFHLSEKAQEKRISKEYKNKIHVPIIKDFAKKYNEYCDAAEHAIRLTDRGDNPWHIVEASDVRYRNITAGKILHNSMLVRLKGTSTIQNQESEANCHDINPDGLTILDTINLNSSITNKDYSKQLKKLKSRLYDLVWEAKFQNRSSIVVFEGWDASGKGGNIRRMTACMDARLYKTISVSSPSDEEKAHHYLWRFWRHIPRPGYVTIYDRSWYGRVLVERVEGLASEDEWSRAYHEINGFEEQLFEHGIILSKFWIHISKDEQIHRFREREETPWKAHKISDEDWRNREKWDLYEHAINDMVAHTSTDYAPWILIPGNDKKYARVEVLKAVCKRLEEGLDKKIID